MAVILIADDEVSIRQVMAMWLVRAGHEVIEAAHGDQARDVLVSRRVDVLITDVHMPELSGTELVIWWRDQQHARQPVLMFSSSGEREVIARQIEGYDVQIYPKPFSPAKLVQVVEQVLLGEDPALFEEASNH